MQIEFFLAQLIRPLHLLVISQRVFDSDSDLIGDMLEQLRVFCRKIIFFQARHDQSTQRPLVRDEGQATCGLESFVENTPSYVRTELLEVAAVYKNRLACRQSPSGRRVVHRNR